MAGTGWPSACCVWSLAALGIFVTLRYPRRFERCCWAFIWSMGWMLLALLQDCVARLHGEVLALILGGGIVYTAGAVLQAMPVKFNNPALASADSGRRRDALCRHQPAAHRRCILRKNVSRRFLEKAAQKVF